MAADRSELHDAFVEAYPGYVAAMLVERRIEVDAVIGDAIVEGTMVLDALLTSLDATPVLDQRVSPLQLFREALRPVDRALTLRGAPTAPDVPEGLDAWDRFGLAPGSSQVLGERAHEAHLRWGVSKATAVKEAVAARRRPRAMIVTSADAHDRFARILESSGYSLGGDPEAHISLALIDVGLGRVAHDAIRHWSARGAHTIAMVDELDPLAVDGLAALGADVVVDTERLIEDPASHLPLIA